MVLLFSLHSPPLKAFLLSFFRGLSQSQCSTWLLIRSSSVAWCSLLSSMLPHVPVNLSAGLEHLSHS